MPKPEFPNSERRLKSEGRGLPVAEGEESDRNATAVEATFGLRISDFFRPSDFGLRVSGFGIRADAYETKSTTQRKPMVEQRSRPGHIKRNLAAKRQGFGPPSAYQIEPRA